LVFTRRISTKKTLSTDSDSAYHQTTVRVPPVVPVPLVEKHWSTSSGQIGLDRYSGFELVQAVLGTSVVQILRAISERATITGKFVT
jgi:hypothetical protein